MWPFLIFQYNIGEQNHNFVPVCPCQHFFICHLFAFLLNFLLSISRSHFTCKYAYSVLTKDFIMAQQSLLEQTASMSKNNLSPTININTDTFSFCQKLSLYVGLVLFFYQQLNNTCTAHYYFVILIFEGYCLLLLMRIATIY